MDLKANIIGQEVRRIVISLKKPLGEYLHVFSILESIDAGMQDYESFAPNFGKEYNYYVKTADGKEEKLFLTVDRIPLTKELYKKPWKDYYSGKIKLQPPTEDYRWPAGEEDWRIIPSNDSYHSELKDLLPRRYCPQYVRYCIPESQPEVLDNILNNGKLKSQLKDISLQNLGYDLSEHRLFLGGFIFLTYNDIYRNISFSEKETCDGIFCRITYKDGNRQPLKLMCRRKGNDDGVVGITEHILDGSKNLYELDFGKTFHSLEVIILDQNGYLLDFYDNLVFIHSINFDMRIGDREVWITDKKGDTIKKVHKYIEGDRTMIGDKNPKGGLVDSSPEYAYRKFEEALDFVFYDGDKEQSESNKMRAEKDILQIIDTARERVLICDVFFDVKSLSRFVMPMSSRTIPVKILSGKQELRQGNKRANLAQAITEMNDKGIANLECRLLIGKKAELHDRFIVADDNVWMLGCSLNEFGNRATTLIRVPKEYRKKLIDRAEIWWKDDSLSVSINDIEDNDKTRKRCFIGKWFNALFRR